MKPIDYLNRQSPAAITLFGLFVIIFFGICDYFAGPDVGLSFFYLLPICGATWFVGRRAGFLMAIFASLLWLLAKLLSHKIYSHPFVPYWNGLVRLGIFAFSIVLTAEIAVRKRVEAALRQQTGILESILNSMGDGVVVADEKGKIVLSNPASERLLQAAQLTPNEWLHNQETYLPDALTTSPTLEHPLLRAIRGESVDGAEMYLGHSKGTQEMWFSATSRPLLDRQNILRGGVVVFTDITARRSLEKQIAEISDREQQRIGQDLHDGLCQHLVSTAFASTLLQQKLEEKKAEESAAALQITDLINDAITQGRTLARGLYPVRLGIDGLSSALEELANNIQKLTNISCEFICQTPIQIHDEVAGINLYRIVQEAVNNAVKHSKATSIIIELQAQQNGIGLTIIDDGIGFPETLKNTNGMGLSIMNHRARLIGASLDIRRGTTGGSIVNCSFQNLNLVKPTHAAKHETTI